ncbi:DNA-binding protein [Frateuria sp. GZRe12]|uniref:DNA-binding protein n=1 Tax=Frateuria sp. GZRe12 TaxID=3351533 RepID=UPI003EDC6495
MPRGITQEQVNAAADAILGTGKNPTVEKIRVQLGTGSPNTIIRMLDAWRSQVGERLQQRNAFPDIPGSVGRAMTEMWRLATEHAERVLTSRFEDERSELETMLAHRLAQERESWDARLQAAEADVARARTERDLAQNACAILDSQLQDSHAMRADLVHQLDELQRICDRQAEELKQVTRRK